MTTRDQATGDQATGDQAAGIARESETEPGKSNFPALLAPNRISLRTLIAIRWIAIAGQLVTVLIVHFGIGYAVPLAAALAVIAVSVLLNVAATIQGRAPFRLAERDAALYIAFDIIQLTVLLTLTGGILNPFAIMILAPLTVSATIFSRRATLALSGLTVCCILVMFAWHYPLPGPLAVGSLPVGSLPVGSLGGDVAGIYKLGLWLALTVSALFIAAYVWHVADDSRRMEAALKATELALSREQRVSSLGALAAAAAHELGTPLGTIAVVARELVDDLPAGSPAADDARLLQSEAKRCRDILAKLAQRPEAPDATRHTDDDPFERLSLSALVEAAAAPHLRPGISLNVEEFGRDGAEPASVRRTPALMHGLGNLLENAIQFARSRVVVHAEWSPREVRLVIRDDGPGFPAPLIGKLGEPYISDRGRARNGGGGGLGLGIFIARTLLENSGGRLAFLNARDAGGGDNGAMVAVTWDRPILEIGGSNISTE